MTQADVRPGQVWQSITTKHHGWLVSIRKVRGNTVQYIPKKGPSHARKGRNNMLIDAFLISFKPLRAA